MCNLLENTTFILLLMFFFHIVDDYYMQGCLANMKQKLWWHKTYDKYDINGKIIFNIEDSIYKYDYIMALICHSFSWTFMIMLPLALYCFDDITYICLFVINVFYHAYIDNEKANKGKINLVVDQLTHFCQIIITWITYISIIKEVL